MRIFKVIAEPLDPAEPPAVAFVVAEDADEAMILLRKDINLSGYALPPAEMIPMSLHAAEVRRLFGEDAAHEKGVFGFHLIGAPTPPLPSS
jgi:hypothetical protein